MNKYSRVGLVLVIITIGLGACSSPKGRIMSDDEEDKVGSHAAGAATYDRLIGGAVEKLLALHAQSSTRDIGKIRIATLAIENASGEELGDWNDQIFELIDTSINRSGQYRTVSTRFVNEALRETRLRTEQLFLPRHRRTFMDVLETQGTPVECLLFPKLTRGTTRVGKDKSQRNYMLTLELVDVKTGWNDKVSERLRKAYTR